MKLDLWSMLCFCVAKQAITKCLLESINVDGPLFALTDFLLSTV